jgi:uncharacterized protein
VSRIIAALAAGLLFGAGLAVSDMVNPARVLAFLDFAGAWDPTLAFVMGGALVPAAIAFHFANRMGRPLLEPGFHVPTRRELDARLIGGAVLFGVGWGLVGWCPGPAVAALGFGVWQVPLFVAAMLVGMVFHWLLLERSPAAPLRA